MIDSDSDSKEGKHFFHKTFLSKCHCDKIIPHGLSVNVEPSIGNQDEAFFETWNGNLQSFSLTPISQVIAFCDQTINKVMRKSKKQKLNYSQNLTETNVKRLFLHLKRTMNSTENTYNEEKQRNLII